MRSTRASRGSTPRPHGWARAARIAAAGLALGCVAACGTSEKPHAGVSKAPAPDSTEPASKTPDASAPESADAKLTKEIAKTIGPHVEGLRDPKTRAQALTALERVASQTQDDAHRRALTKALVPELLAIWDDAAPQRPAMLRLSLSLSDRGAAPLWSRAIAVEPEPVAREQTQLALEAIRTTHATTCTPAVVEALRALMARPQLDGGEDEGALRKDLIDTLAELGQPDAVPTLIDVLAEPVERQPAAVHRAAAVALGRLRAAEAVDALLAVTYRVPDAMTSTNIAERAKQALVAIGEPAVAPTLQMLAGTHAQVQPLAEMHGIDAQYVEMAAASILGAIGSPTATLPLVDRLPRDGCEGGPPLADDASPFGGEVIESRRAVVANALGFIGDRRAVDALCRCATASGDPTDMFSIAEALGRIGGPEATRCLLRVTATAKYDAAMIASRSFEHELRWEAMRFAIMAASDAERPELEAAMSDASRPPDVAREQEAWRPGLQALERCTDSLECWLETLRSPTSDPFARELAAVQAARLAPADERVTLAIADAFSVRDPDARTTMAWLVRQHAFGRRCPECAEVLQDQLEQEMKSRLPKEYQLSVLQARYTIAAVR